MATIDKHTPGTFCWIELSTTDSRAAGDFYSSLFGWKVNEIPIPGGTYRMNQLGGRNISGMADLPAEMKGVPPHWLPYLAVNDVEEVARKVEAAGGKITCPPMDIMEEGRLLIFTDPSGAACGCWQPRNHSGAQVADEAGAVCWTELASRDRDAALKFYGEVFGWSTQDMDMGPEGVYKVIEMDGKGFGGVMQMEGPQWGDLPSHWTTYILVDDVDESASRATSLGGKVVFGPQDIPNVGRLAAVVDPQGAAFSLFRGQAT